MPEFQIGDRVRLTADVAPYPMGLFPAGTAGTVVEVDPTAQIGDPVAFIKLDDHFDDLDEWENVLQVFRYADECSEVTPRAFEILKGSV